MIPVAPSALIASSSGAPGGSLLSWPLGFMTTASCQPDEAGHDVADREIGMVRRLDAACAERADDLADLDRRQIGVEGDPTPLRRVARQHGVAHEHLAFARNRRLGLDQIEVAVLYRSVRTAREQPLAVLHGLSFDGEWSDVHSTWAAESRVRMAQKRPKASENSLVLRS